MKEQFASPATRVKFYEEKLDACNAVLAQLNEAVMAYAKIQPVVREIEHYYTSPAWKEDFDRDERGEFPPDLKRGVLSEDGIYAMLEDNRDWHDILNPDID